MLVQSQQRRTTKVEVGGAAHKYNSSDDAHRGTTIKCQPVTQTCLATEYLRLTTYFCALSLSLPVDVLHSLSTPSQIGSIELP